uniref:RNA helicase n=1 Tax=Pygocentrus nattereri TaxID=42514 RepID=A0AAR2KF56_PYGNA
YFTAGEVLGGVPLCVGDPVHALAVRDGAHEGWRALRVSSSNSPDNQNLASLDLDTNKLRPLIGTVSSCDKDGGFINRTTYFPRSALCQGFEPMKGDWVQAQYFISPTEWSSQAQTVAPLRYQRMDQVSPHIVFGRSGVVEDCVFFCLDSLLLPTAYQPTPGDVVSVVVVESSQSFYCWRALCMAPIKHSLNASVPVLPEAEMQILLQNKGGLVVSEETQFGSLLMGQTKELLIWIQCVTVTNILMSSANDSFMIFHRFISTGHHLCNGKCHLCRNLGRCAELLLLHFSSFTIGRRLEVSVSSAEESLLKPSAPYCPAVPLPQPQRHAQVITVMAPAPPIRRRLPNFLGNYPVPQALRECVEAQNDVLVVQPALGEPLCLSSMIPRFSALLWLEELQAEKELKEFTISGALLRKGAVYLHLEVPGLSEGRPNLFIGDRVVLKKPCSGGCVVEYIGYVTEISEEDVSLRVNSEFQKSYLGEPLDVEFTFNRVTIRRCHCLVLLVLQLQSPIWTGKWEPEQLQVENEGEPPRQDKKSGQKQSSLTMDMVSVATQTKTGTTLSQFFNCNLNPAQKEAVKRILSGDCRPTPYVLFGPPGTGKTVTLIEAILQVYHRVPGSRLLVCTPSNSAADLICIRLHESGYLHAASLARVNATCRQEESIPDVLRQYSRAGEDVRHASFHRIVVSTCSSAGMFYQIGLRVGHFTHVFLDEAGQATEPESLIPLGLLSEKTGQVVLAGDPKQLGPIVKSKLAEAFGLGVSLLERLMAIALYSCNEKGYNPLLVTKLVYNYRSHEVLLSLPSRLFYGGELCVRSPRAVVDSLCHWSRLPTKGFPLMFHGVRGTEMRECSNPSWFNPGEAVQVMLYCCQLAKRLYNPIPANDIGIIAPYKKQVEKIRVLLQKVGLADIKVGSVEEFQGQEFLVIILSTVRSNEALPSGDLQSALGFLSNPKRFNVAITRPKALLIVIGNPHVLIKDPCFHALLQYTYENGAFLGCDPPVSLRVAHRLVTRILKS